LVDFLCTQIGLPAHCQAEPLDAELSTVSVHADKHFKLSGPATGLLHLELESSWDGTIPDRLLLYNVLAEHRHQVPVYSVVMLLRPEANSTAATGLLERMGHGDVAYLNSRYRVIRLWEMPCADLMAGHLGLVPLALLTNDARPQLPQLVDQIGHRLEQKPIKETATRNSGPPVAS
jgi:hypothetical protein